MLKDTKRQKDSERNKKTQKDAKRPKEKHWNIVIGLFRLKLEGNRPKDAHSFPRENQFPSIDVSTDE